jgi:acetylglutamate kinase
MIPKMDNSFKAIEEGVSEVIILHAKNLLAKKGTLLRESNSIEGKQQRIQRK